MKLLTAIILLTLTISCQKEIDWGIEKVKCIKGHSWVMPAGNIDTEEHLMFTPLNNGYHIWGHPDFVKTWGDCMPMNLKDSSEWYKVVSKGVYRINGNESPYVQIGGVTNGGWLNNETSTYFFIMQQDQWDTIGIVFKPKFD